MNNKITSNTKRFKAFIKKTTSLSNEEQILEAGRIISKVEEVDVNQAYSNVQKRISTKGRILKMYNEVSRYAAILVLPLIIVSVWALIQKNEITTTQGFAMQEITCPVGIRSNVILPDGTQVWLNAESTIKYAMPFIQENRNVELVGEAYFDVAKNKKSPFIIQSDNVKVNVVGTQFNFKSYPADNTVEVALIEGKINLSLLSDANLLSKKEMNPNDHFIFNKTTKEATIINKNLASYIGWKENKLIFDETPMPEVKKMLERWYGVEIEIADKSVESYKFTTTFVNESLNQVLELLEFSSPINMDYYPGEIDKKTNQITKSKIRISKKN